MTIKTAGITWYTSETYETVPPIFSDKEDFITTSYSDWLTLAEQVEQKLISDGIPVLRVHLDTTDFPKWATENGFTNLDSAARRDYADFIASQNT